MLQIKNLTVTHKKDLHVLFDNFSITVNMRDKAVIIGEEGNGKSTLLKIIEDTNSVTDYAEVSGEIIRNGMKICRLSQENFMSECSKTVYEFFCSNSNFYDFSPSDFADTARLLNFSSEMFYSDQTFCSLSGGEAIKLRLADIIIKKPDLILLDEPSNNLDMESLECLERFIQSLDVPVIFISHDEALIKNTANMIIHIEQVIKKTKMKYTVAHMPYEEYIKARRDGIERQEQQAKNEQSEYRKQMDRYMRIESKVEHKQNNVSRQNPHEGKMLKRKMQAVKSMKKRFDRNFDNMTEMPDYEEAINFRFPEVESCPGKTILQFQRNRLSVGERLLSKDIRLEVKSGEKICITGNNGCGKTTLIREIYSLLKDRSDIKIGYMPQNYDDLMNKSVTPAEFISRSGNKEDITFARTVLGSMKFTYEETEHPLSELSGGQKAKLFYIKMIIDKCNVLILDEPTRNLSPLSVSVICNVLSEYRGTIISVSHDREFIKRVMNGVYDMTASGLVKLM